MAFFNNASEMFFDEKSVAKLYVNKQLVWSNQKEYEELLYIEVTTGQYINDFTSGKFYPTEELIPVLDQNNIPCLYDTTKKIFLYNQGTGKFAYARKLAWIEDLVTGEKYVENNGTVPCRLSNGMAGLFNTVTKEFTQITNNCLCSDFFILNYSVTADNSLTVQEIKSTSNKSLIYMYPLEEGYTYTISAKDLDYKISDFFIFDDYNFAEGEFNQIDSVTNGNTNIATYTAIQNCYLCCTISKKEAATLTYDEFVQYYSITKQEAHTLIPANRYFDTGLKLVKDEISKVELSFALAELPVNVENRLQYFIPLGACEGTSGTYNITYNNRFCILLEKRSGHLEGFRCDIFTNYGAAQKATILAKNFNTKKHTIIVDINNKKITIDGNTTAIGTEMKGSTSGTTLHLNKCKYYITDKKESETSGWTSMNFYSLKVYDKEGNLYRHYIPCGKNQIKEVITNKINGLS